MLGIFHKKTPLLWVPCISPCSSIIKQLYNVCINVSFAWCHKSRLLPEHLPHLCRLLRVGSVSRTAFNTHFKTPGDRFTMYGVQRLSFFWSFRNLIVHHCWTRPNICACHDWTISSLIMDLMTFLVKANTCGGSWLVFYDSLKFGVTKCSYGSLDPPPSPFMYAV